MKTDSDLPARDFWDDNSDADEVTVPEPEKFPASGSPFELRNNLYANTSRSRELANVKVTSAIWVGRAMATGLMNDMGRPRVWMVVRLLRMKLFDLASMTSISLSYDTPFRLSELSASLTLRS